MGRRIAPALGALILAGYWLGGAAVAGPPSGDCDFGLDSTDAAVVLQWEAGLSIQPGCAIFLDLNRDALVNSVDASIILQYEAGLVR
jgi:hypothetical protein